MTRTAGKPAGPVVITGLPRSGTSWLGKTLGRAPGHTFYREPDVRDPEGGPPLRFRYLPSGHGDAAADNVLRRALEGRNRDPLVMRHDMGPLLRFLPRRFANPLGRRFPALYLPRSGTVIKLVFCNLMLERIQDLAPHARQIHILRHPCATFASWERMGWNPNVKPLLTNEQLMRDHLAPFERTLASADSFWERAGALWGAMATVVTRQAEHHPWTLVQHEWLCADPVGHFRRTYERLGLPWDESIARFVRDSDRPGKNDPFDLRRSAADAATSWKTKVDAADVAACRRFVEPFGLPWYPDFSSEAPAPTWA